jgi:hypothetical protein
MIGFLFVSDTICASTFLKAIFFGFVRPYPTTCNAKSLSVFTIIGQKMAFLVFFETLNLGGTPTWWLVN